VYARCFNKCFNCVAGGVEFDRVVEEEVDAEN
jgi:hypothetical protein